MTKRKVQEKETQEKTQRTDYPIVSKPWYPECVAIASIVQKEPRLSLLQQYILPDLCNLVLEYEQDTMFHRLWKRVQETNEKKHRKSADALVEALQDCNQHSFLLGEFCMYVAQTCEISMAEEHEWITWGQGSYRPRTFWDGIFLTLVHIEHSIPDGLISLKDELKALNLSNSFSWHPVH